jgi:uncharacterized membrane protein YcjF (UPF0283 family)
MAQTASKRKTRLLLKTVFMGALSLALYAILLTEEDLVMEYFGRGGWYAMLPIITAFTFSFVHGRFTGNFWTALGIEAARKRG